MRNSMHCHCPSIPQSPCVIDDQPRIHPLDVIVTHIVEVYVRKLGRFCKEGVCGFFIHPRIVMQGLRGGYSYFPVGVVHVANVAARQE